MEKIIIRQYFLKFFSTYNLSWKGLFKLILDNLNQFGIGMLFLSGQGCNSAATMSGKYNSVKAHINQSHPLLMYIHFSLYSFNLAVYKSIRN